MEQHVPIFVGSTYLDLREHREKVRETLTRMETFVHGMEQFGARSGAPVEECLAEVARCEIYVGIFAMRYGTIPEGYDKSLTQLEYEKAQELHLPSLLFLIDEEKALVFPSSIDVCNIGKLNALKKILLAKHTCDFFTTPEDLAGKVGTAVHEALKRQKRPIEIESGIEAVIPSMPEIAPQNLLRRFYTLPRRWEGIEFTAIFNNVYLGHVDSPREAEITLCDRLKLKTYDSVEVKWQLADTAGSNLTIVAEEELAYKLIDIDFRAHITMKVETIFSPQESPEDQYDILALKVKEIINITPFSEPEDGDIPF